ncbi:GNAT family N-acetyltransferase [Clostridiaceae bacterium M8S5]|nr:GNAT family N-acetyltransferase [Clostridiaceae bacterium M8S5]
MKLSSVLTNYNLPDGITVETYDERYFEAIQKLYEEEGWMTFIEREDDAKNAWVSSQVALIVLKNGIVIGFMRALSDELITTYIAEILIKKEYRGNRLGNLLIEICHSLYPKTRLDLLSSEEADDFYRAIKFKEITGFRKSYVV